MNGPTCISALTLPTLEMINQLGSGRTYPTCTATHLILQHTCEGKGVANKYQLDYILWRRGWCDFDDKRGIVCCSLRGSLRYSCRLEFSLDRLTTAIQILIILYWNRSKRFYMSTGERHRALGRGIVWCYTYIHVEHTLLPGNTDLRCTLTHASEG